VGQPAQRAGQARFATAVNAQAIEAEFASEAKQIVAESAGADGGIKPASLCCVLSPYPAPARATEVIYALRAQPWRFCESKNAPKFFKKLVKLNKLF
jgi:hypothetical protein